MRGLIKNRDALSRMVHKGTSAGLGDNMKLKVVLLVLVVLFPGCLEDTQEEPSEQGENGFVGVGGYTNISMEIIPVSYTHLRAHETV